MTNDFLKEKHWNNWYVSDKKNSDKEFDYEKISIMIHLKICLPVTRLLFSTLKRMTFSFRENNNTLTLIIISK